MFELVSLGVNIPAAVRLLSTVTCHMCHMQLLAAQSATNQMRQSQSHLALW